MHTPVAPLGLRYVGFDVSIHLSPRWGCVGSLLQVNGTRSPDKIGIQSNVPTTMLVHLCWVSGLPFNLTYDAMGVVRRNRVLRKKLGFKWKGIYGKIRD